jgi:hypothetical protein
MSHGESVPRDLLNGEGSSCGTIPRCGGSDPLDLG